MRFAVTPLRDRGVKIHHDKKLKSYTGDLSICTILHPLLKRNVSEAMLHDDNGWTPIGSMIDVQITVLAAHVMVLRGVEYHNSRRGLVEYVQEWMVRHATTETSGAAKKVIPVEVKLDTDKQPSTFKYWLEDQEARFKNSNNEEDLEQAWNAAIFSAIEAVKGVLMVEGVTIDSKTSEVVQMALRRRLASQRVL